MAVRVLFVCHANVCRSPMAEAVFRHLVEEAGLRSSIEIDSAGVMAMDGSPPHPLTVAACAAHGVVASGQARQLFRDDLFSSDHVLLADASNLRRLERMMNPSAFGPSPGTRATLRLLGELDPTASRGRGLDIADPIGKDAEAFDRCYDRVRRCCEQLLTELQGSTGSASPG